MVRYLRLIMKKSNTCKNRKCLYILHHANYTINNYDDLYQYDKVRIGITHWYDVIQQK